MLAASVRRRRLENGACARLGILDALEHTVSAEPEGSRLEGLDAALRDLPAGQRQAIHLRVVDDLDYARIAERLETTPAAARVRVHSGLATLRAQLANPKEAR